LESYEINSNSNWRKKNYSKNIKKKQIKINFSLLIFKKNLKIKKKTLLLFVVYIKKSYKNKYLSRKTVKNDSKRDSTTSNAI